MSEDKMESIPQLGEEAQKALAAKFMAEARRADAEALVAEAEAKVSLEAAREQAARSDKARSEADRQIADDEKYVLHNREALGIALAKDKHHHKYQFCYKVTDSTVNECLDMLNFWHRTEPGCDIEIVFYSPGGEVLPGMRLFDHIRWLISEGHYITTVAMGFAASMGGVLLQSGNKRVIGREAYLLIHELSFVAGGDMGTVEDSVEMAKMIQKRIIKIFTDRAKETGRAGYLTPSTMKARWNRKDWWLDSEMCYKLGLVDEVR